VKQINWNQEKIERLAQYIPELEMAEEKLKQTIDFIHVTEKKAKHRSLEKLSSHP
jgi:prefoldin subunit 5